MGEVAARPCSGGSGVYRAQLVHGGELAGRERASPPLPCRCPDGLDGGWMDRGPGQPDSGNRKPNLLKLIQGEGRK